jgi:hypothetical protein
MGRQALPRGGGVVGVGVLVGGGGGHRHHFGLVISMAGGSQVLGRLGAEWGPL